MHPRDQLAVVLRRWQLILIGTVLAAAAAYLVTASLPKVYESQVKLIVAQAWNTPTPDINVLLASQRLSKTFAELVTTRPILARVITDLSLPDNVDQLKSRTDAKASTDSLYVTIMVQDGSPVRAARTANALADRLIEAAPAILVTATGVEQPRLLSVVEPAVPDASPVAPRVLLTTLLAAIVALLGAVGLIVALEYLNDTVRTGREAEHATGAATLAQIERIRGAGGSRMRMYALATLLFPRSNVAESFRTLRTSLDFASIDKGVRSIVVTSSLPREGKTTVAANLAIVYAQSGRRTILVDADFRQPSLATLFRLVPVPGLTDLLRNDELQLEAVLQATQEPRLMVLTSGPLPPNPAELVATDRMRMILGLLLADADVVIFDTPPLSVTDGAVLAAEVDGTLLVVRVGRVRRNLLTTNREALTRVGARVLGVVLNDTSEQRDYGYYAESVSESEPIEAS